MAQKRYFEEVQKMQQWWVWLLLFPVLVGLILYFNYTFDTSDKMEINEILLVIGINAIIMIGVVLLFRFMRLEIKVSSEGLHFSYPPFQNKERIINTDEIERFEIRTYKSIKEYGGHGYKKNSLKYGGSFTISGNKGLQLYLKNGKKMLLGTQRPSALKSAMDKLMRRENV